MSNYMNLRVGTGKFFIDNDCIDVLSDEINRFGGKAFFLGGPTTTDIITSRFKKLGINAAEHIIVKHSEACSKYWAEVYASDALKDNCTVIVGIGGGKCLDLAKCVSTYSDLPLINIPTSVATCVASSSVIIVYTNDGKPDGSVSMKKEVDVVIADPKIIATSPKRYMAAGILDSIAKYPEVIHNQTITSHRDCTLEKYICTVNGKVIYDFLAEEGFEVYENQTRSLNFKNLILTNLLHTSVVSGFSYGVNQLALAHCLYDFMRRKYTEEAATYLHGEMVGVGVIAQMAFNNESHNEIEKIRNLMIAMHMPTRLQEIAFICNDENLNELIDYLIERTGLNENHKPMLINALKIIS